MSKIIGDYLTESKKKLQQELIGMAADPVILRRRFRMLGQLGQYESQIYKKINDFRTNDLDDYVRGADFIIKEINAIINRNS